MPAAIMPAVVSNPITRLDVQVDGQTPGSWAAVLDQFADASIYQTWAYGAVRWGEANLSHLVMSCEGRPLAAAQLRVMRLPVLPTGVAYLRWGPMCHGKNQRPDPAVVEKMLVCLREEYCLGRGLVLQIIPPAFPDTERGSGYSAMLARCGFRTCCGARAYRTVLVDLTRPPEAIRRGFDSKWRNSLNGSEKQPLELEITDTAQAYGEFVQIYRGMWQRKRFESAVDVDEFGRIQDLLAPEEKMRIILAREEGQAIGALVCSLTGDTAIYLLGATNERARELKASYWLHWRAMLWLKAAGMDWYDLGGIDPRANPGGHHFKRGFGGKEVVQVLPATASAGVLAGALDHGWSWWRGRKKPVSQGSK